MRPLHLLATLALACLATPALACGFHTYTPQATLVDSMLASDHIVLARPDPDDPYRFVPTHAIEGGLGSVEIPHLVDSAARRRLALYPDDTVLFARGGPDGAWQRLAYVDAELRPVVDRVAVRLTAWELGDDADRFEMFAGLADHPDMTVRSLALRELDRADYGTLRGLEIDVDASAILPRLGGLAEADLVAIRVLLLGMSGDGGARTALMRGFERAQRSDGPLLGAYATALVELEGPDAVEALAHGYLADVSVSPAAREMIVEAMAIHSLSGAEATRSAIHAALADTLLHVPELAPAVARQFGRRSDWSQRDPLTRVLRQQAVRTPMDLFVVSQYVALAEWATGPKAKATQ